MKYLLIILLFIITYYGNCGNGGTTPAAASTIANTITLPYYKTTASTSVNDVNNPAGFVSPYTTGYDWFYYFCPTSTGEITTTISFTTTATGVHPSISVWEGIPGSGGVLINSETSSGDNTTDGILACESKVVTGHCYYIMIDNWPPPNTGFTYDISVYSTPTNPACSNIGFENNDLSSWTGTTGVVSTGISTDPYPIYEATGFTTTTTQHSVTSAGFDANVGGTILPKVCPGQGTHSMMLGDYTTTGSKGATIEQRFSVDATNALFTYYYAVIFQDNGHDPWEQPVFKVEVLDCDGNPIICGDYLVVANAGAAGFTKIPGSTDEYYKSWTPVFLDLTAYIGTCITVRFATGDCTLGGHYGYAYVDASCQPLVISGASSVCLGSSTTLTAPAGGASYSWKVQGTATVIGTAQTLSVTPLVNTTYECVITSVAGCQSTLIQPIVVNPLPTITGVTSKCVSATSQLTGSVTPDATTPWVSATPANATISSTGLVTAVAAGTSIITYKNTNGCLKTTTFTVYANPTISGTLSSCIGGTSQLTGSATADATTPWTSSNTAVATISSTGLVTAISAGSSTITYLNSNGCSITALFTVNPNPTITGTLSICLPGTSQLTGSATANGTTPWISATTATATISNTGLVTAVAAGSSIITYKNTNGCTSTSTINVTNTPVITNPGPQTVCDSYTLPAITGTNLTGTQKYYNNSQALGGTVITGSITTTQTVWMYDSNGSCSDEKSYLVTVNITPSLSVSAPDICNTGTSLVTATIANSNLYNFNWTVPLGVTSPGNVSSFTTSTAGNYTVSVTNKNLLCNTDFDNTVIVVAGSSQIVDQSLMPCWKTTASDSKIEVWGNGKLGVPSYSGNQFVELNANLVSTLYQDFTAIPNNTVSISFAHRGRNGTDVMSVDIGPVGGPYVSLGSFSAGNSAWIYSTVNYTFPNNGITNYTLRFNSVSSVGGASLGNFLDAISITTIGCLTPPASKTITVTTVNITNPGPQTVCDSYTLPVITGTGLTGNQKYYNNSQALGGTVITGPITSTQTIWMYDINGTCSDEKSFLVTVNHTPVITNPGSQTVCDSYTLPVILGANLTGGQKYYNNSQSLSGAQITGSLISTQTVWIYDAQGACHDEKSFLVTVNHTPIITNPGAQTVCDSYTLPVITGSSLSGGQKYYNNSQALSGTQITGPITSTQTVWIYDAQGACHDEKSFLVTVNHTPIITNPGAQTVCDTYSLPTITGTNLTGSQKYYNNSHALSGIQITGPITSTQTVWIYDVIGICHDEISFLVTVNHTPIITSNPGGLSICASYILPSITGTYLTGGQKYYNNSQALGGTQISGPILTTQTVWIYDNNAGCKDEQSFLVTVNTTPPSINSPGNQNVCDSYTLPAITGTNLTGNQKYYNNSQALGGTQISGTLTTNQTIWIYDVQGTCHDEKSFTLTVNLSPSITNPGAQTVCDTYTLPVITGINLSGNQKYYNNSQAFGGTVITGPITSTQTVWIYDINGICSDEESFLVTVNHTPSIINPGAQTVCDSYTLPTITGTNLSGNQKYYNNSHALSGIQITSPITTTQTVWIYDAQGACHDEKSFLVTILLTPSITNPGNQTVCDSYTLPTILGTNLSGNQKYYNNSQALSGTQISGSVTSTQTVWIYDTQGTCHVEKSFIITVNHTPNFTNPGAQIVCDSYTLPTITGTNLTGNENFYNNSQALGGTQISGALTSTQTVWIYDAQGTCKDEKSFLVTVHHTPSITNPGAQIVCDSYTLPTILGTNLTGSQKFYNNSHASSGTQITGPITSTQTVWIYDADGTCSDEKSFLVTVNYTPSITNPGPQILCDLYTLPTITGTHLSGNQKFYNNSQALGGTQITGPISSTQTIWIYDANATCTNEINFSVTVNHTPVITNPGAQSVCDSYTLPTISGTNLTGGQKFYNNSHALSGIQISGALTTSQTVWIYDADGACTDEKSFLVTVNYTPSITNPGPQTVCDSYTLATILGTNLSGNQKFYNNSQAGGGTVISGPITTTQTVWIYDANATCSDETSFLVTVNHTPSLVNPGAQTVCDTYTLPTITGINLTGNEKFYTNSQALSGTQITGPITSTQTIWLYDAQGVCKDEKSFLVTVNYTPSITNPGAQIVCDSYILPTISGTQLSGNQKYYTNSQALSGTQITSPIISTQTVWIYDANASCSNEKSFLVTVNYTPNITNPGNQTVCDSYTLPTITGTNLSGGEKFYNNSQLSGGIAIAGSITSTQTVWIYDTNGACSNEKSFIVTVHHTPNLFNTGNQIVCDSYTLPTITGTNLSGNEKYYNNSKALGGIAITGAITSSQPVWIYDEDGVCRDEKNFTVTINYTPSITNPGNQASCDTYTLPNILGTHLSGNQKYYNNSQALGGTQITGSISSTQTIWIFDSNGNCSDEESFLVTIYHTPSLINIGNHTVCDSYMLPTISGTNLTGGQKYYNNSQALNGTPISGSITSTQKIWMYDIDGICYNEINLTITVNHTPSIDNPGNKTVCDSYILPIITGTNLTGGQKYYNNSQAFGGTQITGSITTSQTIWMYDIDGLCSNEKSFEVKIDYTPNFTNINNPTVCDSYTLPNITGTNLSGNQNYYTNSQALGGSVISGTLNSNQIIWLYDANASCISEKSFIVTVNHTPSLINPGNSTICDSYSLPIISGTNLSGNEKYYTNSQLLGGTEITGPIITSQTVWIYDNQGTCYDEDKFIVTINYTPNLTNTGDNSSCDSYLLSPITGTNLTGNQKYYNNSQALGGIPINGVLTSSQTIWMYDVNGTCFDEEKFIITINPTPTINFIPDITTGCVPLTVKFKNNTTPKSDNVSWNFGDGNLINSDVQTGEISHVFTTVNCFDIELTVTSNGCTNNLKLADLICTYPIPEASFTMDENRVSILQPRINFTNTSNLAATYYWNFGDGNESKLKNPSNDFPAQKGNYQIILIASNSHGCSDTASNIIEIYDELIFYIPNTFTPDDDNYNQVFTPIFNAGYDPMNFTMYIFDRWGEIVFETHDSSKGWTGMYGKEEMKKCQDGLYIWKIMYKEVKTDKVQTIVGDVILIR